MGPTIRVGEGLGSYATALAAATEIEGDPERAVHVLAPKLSEYMRRKGTTFEDVVARKRELRLALCAQRALGQPTDDCESRSCLGAHPSPGRARRRHAGTRALGSRLRLDGLSRSGWC